jgi:hypothetical protein
MPAPCSQGIGIYFFQPLNTVKMHKFGLSRNAAYTKGTEVAMSVFYRENPGMIVKEPEVRRLPVSEVKSCTV